MLFASVAFISAPAQAGWTCTGKVSDLSLDPTGNVYMTLLKSDNTNAWGFKQLCNVRADVNGVATSSCKIIYAQLLTAEAMNREVTFWFDSGNAMTPDCSPVRFPSWSFLATTGASAWYFGPKIADQ